MTAMPVGVALPTTDALEAVDLARAVEDHGLDHVSLADVQIGDGTPSAEPTLVAAAVAAATHRVRIEFGILVLPLRDPVWTATQIATLQRLSTDRILLGVGVGGFPNTPFWRAVGAPERRLGAALDAALDRLPGLLAGTDPDVTLAPTAQMPPVLIGGGTAAVDRANRYDAGWFPSLITPTDLTEHAGRVASGRVHVAVHAALGHDRADAHARLVRDLVDHIGLDPDRARTAALLGGADELAERIRGYAAGGATSVTVALDGTDPISQLDTVAAARAQSRTCSHT